MQRKLGIAYMADVAFVACPPCTVIATFTCPTPPSSAPLHPSHIHYAPFVTLWPFELLTNAHNNCQIWQNGSATAILNRKLPNICPATFFSFSLSLSLPLSSLSISYVHVNLSHACANGPPPPFLSRQDVNKRREYSSKLSNTFNGFASTRVIWESSSETSLRISSAAELSILCSLIYIYN